MNEKLKQNIKLIFGAILVFILILLGASIIKDLLIFIFKESLNKTVFQIIHIILIYIFIVLISKTRPIKNLSEELTNKFKRK